MLKSLVSIILSISLILSMSTVTLADSAPKISVTLNGASTSFEDQVYFNEKGQIMCPLRELAEELNYLVTWDSKTKSIMLSKGLETIELKLGESQIIVNNRDINMSSTPVTKNGKIFVPIAFLSEALGLIVGWDSKLHSLKINQPKESAEDYFLSSDDKSTQDKLDTYMKELQKHKNFHGSVLVTKGGRVLLNKGYGPADFQQHTMNKTQTKFAIGSVTKQFTAMAIMQLSEQGLLSTEDKVSKYFPELANGDSITIHNLLVHTSGLANYTELNELYTLTPNEQNFDGIINLIKDIPLEFKPGEMYKYSNTGYLLLGSIVEKVSGISYEDYLQKNIFDPLNMTDSGICYGKENKIHDATPYNGYLEVFPVDDEFALRQTYGAGSIYSTVEDLYRWDRSLNTEKLVKRETLDKIFAEHVSISGPVSYGYGWFIADTNIGKEISHNGTTFGFTANIARYTDEDLTIIILTNSRHYEASKLTNTLASITFNKKYEMPEVLEAIKIDDPNLYDKYVGEYELFEGATVKIIKENNQIYAMMTGQDKYEIFPKSEKEYFYKVVDAKITFIKNDNGEVTGLTLHQNGQDITGSKIK